MAAPDDGTLGDWLDGSATACPVCDEPIVTGDKHLDPVYGYVRVSTAVQADSGLGLAAQRAAIVAEADRRGWTDVEWIGDQGTSGSVAPDQRPALGPVLAAIDGGDVLVVAKLDRLGRSALDVLTVAKLAAAHGWSLVVLDLGLDTATPVGRFTLTALAAVAELERNLVSERTRDAMAAARARGVRLGRPVTLPDEVRDRIVAMRDDAMTYRAIATTAEHGPPGPATRVGKAWTNVAPQHP